MNYLIEFAYVHAKCLHRNIVTFPPPDNNSLNQGEIKSTNSFTTYILLDITTMGTLQAMLGDAMKL